MKMTEDQFKERCADILRENITFSGQLRTYVIHGALEEIWKLHIEQCNAKESNATPLPINPEIGVLAKLKLKHIESGSDLSFSEWLKLPMK